MLMSVLVLASGFVVVMLKVRATRRMMWNARRMLSVRARLREVFLVWAMVCSLVCALGGVCFLLSLMRGWVGIFGGW